MTTPALEHDHEHATEPVATVATVTPEPEVPLAERSLLPRVAAELFGTFVLVTAIVVVAAFGALGTQGSTALHVALAGGLALAAMVASFGAVSGAHLNPAVSLGAAIAGRLSWADLAPYVVAQTLGGVAAGGLLRAVVPAELPAATGATDARAFISTTANGFGSHSPIATLSGGQVTFSTAQVLLVELVVTGVLVAVVLAVTRRPHPSAPLAIGGALTVAILVAAPVSNAAVNPARATATAFFAEGWAMSQLWLFWLAPLAGAVIAGLVTMIVERSAVAYEDWDDDLDEDEELDETDEDGDLDETDELEETEETDRLDPADERLRADDATYDDEMDADAGRADGNEDHRTAAAPEYERDDHTDVEAVPGADARPDAPATAPVTPDAPAEATELVEDPGTGDGPGEAAADGDGRPQA
ncbi:MAG TPA: aquaporin [Actinotalea caeni]|uniref:aquaporin n=1 Tax=Actinotalea caeni TaxID=1348467 RepID=UPI002B4B30A8|nr:aquaporin [Actinotalea caeni]HLV55040.1 aquaporin [Actinotalea caeni]